MFRSPKGKPSQGRPLTEEPTGAVVVAVGIGLAGRGIGAPGFVRELTAVVDMVAKTEAAGKAAAFVVESTVISDAATAFMGLFLCDWCDPTGSPPAKTRGSEPFV
jgi:hypothetical protein